MPKYRSPNFNHINLSIPHFPLFPLRTKAVFALPVVKSIYQPLFLSTSPDCPYCICIPIMLQSILTDIPDSNLIPILHRSPRLSICSCVHHHPISRSFTQSPNGTGYKVFVIRSLSSQNMCARASKWLEKNLHLLEIRLRLLSFKR